MNQQNHKILIIGAGPSGLSLLRAFQIQNHLWSNNFQIVCVQKQSQSGGQWNYFAKHKLDKHGIPIPSTNQYLWTNAPKQCFQYPDYSFDQHFNGIPMPSYLPRQYLKQYFTKRFSNFSIQKHIKFDTIAKNIKFQQESKKFIAQIQDLKTNYKTVEQFDYVIVASGHYSIPNIPQVQGLKQFKGKLIHSIQVTDYLDYKNQRILVIGTGLSAEDAVLQCYKYGAKQITITYRTRPMSQKFPQSIKQLPLLTKVEGKTVTFLNGEQKQFDTIIMCTGYLHNFNFLQQNLRLKNSNKLWANDLYLGVNSINNPKLFYIGMQAQYFSFMMFDIQAYLIRDIILNKKQRISYEQMKKDNQFRESQQNKIKNAYDLIEFMGEYMKDLIRQTEYEGYEIDKVIELYFELQRHKQENILAFRDNRYKSTVSGKWSILKQQTWLQAGSKFENGSQQSISTLSIDKMNDLEMDHECMNEIEACE